MFSFKFVLASKFNGLPDASTWERHRHPKVNVCKGTPQHLPYGPPFLTKSVNGTAILSVTRLKMLTMLCSIPLSLPLLSQTFARPAYNFLTRLHLLVSILLPRAYFGPSLLLFRWPLQPASSLGGFLCPVCLSRCAQVHAPVEALLKSLPSVQPGSPDLQTDVRHLKSLSAQVDTNTYKCQKPTEKQTLSDKRFPSIPSALLPGPSIPSHAPRHTLGSSRTELLSAPNTKHILLFFFFF